MPKPEKADRRDKARARKRYGMPGARYRGPREGAPTHGDRVVLAVKAKRRKANPDK